MAHRVSRSPEPSIAAQQNVLFDFENTLSDDHPSMQRDSWQSQSIRVVRGFPSDDSAPGSDSDVVGVDSPSAFFEGRDTPLDSAPESDSNVGIGGPSAFEGHIDSGPESDVDAAAGGAVTTTTTTAVDQVEDPDQRIHRLQQGLRELLRSSGPTADQAPDQSSTDRRCRCTSYLQWLREWLFRARG